MTSLIILPSTITFVATNHLYLNGDMIIISTTDSGVVVGQSMNTPPASTTISIPSIDWAPITPMSSQIYQSYESVGIKTSGLSIQKLWTAHVGAYIVLGTWMQSLGLGPPTVELTAVNAQQWESISLSWYQSTSDPLFRQMATVMIMFNRIWGSVLP